MTPRPPRTALASAVVAGLALALASACAPTAPDSPAPDSPAPDTTAGRAEPTRPSPTPSTSPATRAPQEGSRSSAGAPRKAEASRSPEPRRSFLSVPAIGLSDFPVVRYRGTPDDRPGTAIQNAGPMASPRGPGGGVGPGVVGNFIVTGHRTSHTMPFADLPSVRSGDRVVVRSGGTEHVYEITRTRWTSFRSPQSLAAQAAPVPGRPRQEATRPMITLSTCATPEDHANGNYWSDEFGNPEHRIDKIGVLVARRPA
jgi:sortase A